MFFIKTFGCVRYIYNWALSKRIESFQNNNDDISWKDMSSMLTSLKKESDKLWLNDVSAECLQQSLIDLNSAYTNFFRRKKGFPNFKSKRNCNHYRAINIVVVDQDKCKIRLPKIGWVNFFSNRKYVGKFKSVTISMTPTMKFFISINVDDGKDVIDKPEISYDTSVGIDVGIKNFAVTSNGDVINNPKFLEKSIGRIKVLQKRLNRKTKGSNNYVKSRIKLAKEYEKITNRRNDFLHKISTNIVRENQTIIVEDLNISGLMKNHNMAKSILSASWYSFFKMLEYKCGWYGKNFITIGRFDPSSKMCECGYINDELKLSDRLWSCPNCGIVNDRDFLAAKNIKKFGLQRRNLIGYSPRVAGVELVE